MTARLKRARSAWRALDHDQRFAGLAAGGLLVAMFLPWYEKNFLAEGRAVEDSISAFGAVSFVEAAIFLVSLGVVVLVLARGEGRPFHLPGGDGTVIFAAGVWATLLIFYRVFDKPDVSGPAATIGIQWGFFVAFVAAGALTLAGHRLRVAGAPEPPLEDDPTARTRVAPSPSARSDRARARRAVTRQDAAQLSFDEAPRKQAPPDEGERPRDDETAPTAARLRPGEIPSARDRR